MKSLFFMHSIKLFRYLIAWRVNTPMVRLPLDFTAAISQTLGYAIADSISTRDARRWLKHLDTNKLNLFQRPAIEDPYPETPWPVHAVILPHTNKRNYCQGEIIYWELKLIGDSADHGFFLEAIIPAMEKLGYTEQNIPQSRLSIWGHYDILSVWVANGNNWDPLINESQLNLKYHPKPLQWNSHLTEDYYHKGMSQQKRLIWLRPFEFDVLGISQMKDKFIPEMQSIIESVVRRWSFFSSSRIRKEIWDLVPSNLLIEVKKAWEIAGNMRISSYNLIPALRNEPGLWTGELTYENIPVFLMPYLDMAAIFHVGKKTHYGCGTFALCKDDNQTT
jgi:hypothetical protein